MAPIIDADWRSSYIRCGMQEDPRSGPKVDAVKAKTHGRNITRREIHDEASCSGAALPCLPVSPSKHPPRKNRRQAGAYIPLPGVTGRSITWAWIGEEALVVAAVANNTLEVVDLTDGKVIKSLGGLKDTQDALFLGGDLQQTLCIHLMAM